MVKLHHDKLTRKTPPLLGCRISSGRGCSPSPSNGSWAPKGFLGGDGPTEGEAPQKGPKTLEKIWLLLFPKNHKRLVFRIRESQVQWGSDSSQLPPAPISYFLVFACHLIQLPQPKDTFKRRVFQSIFQRKEAIQQCWSRPTADILWS